MPTTGEKICPFGSTGEVCDPECALWVAEFEMCSIKLIAISPFAHLEMEKFSDVGEENIQNVTENQLSDEQRKEMARFDAVNRAKTMRDGRK